MILESLKNPELQEKLKACTSTEELVALAKAEGLELTDEQLESVSGGTEWGDVTLPKCNRWSLSM